jgi:hypothetical protein
MRTSLLLIASIAAAGCPAPTSHIKATADPCNVTPPAKTTASPEITGKIAADLSKLSSAPISAGIEGRYKDVVEATFRQIPERSAACEMLLRAYTCTLARKDPGANQLAAQLISMINPVCDPALPVPARAAAETGGCQDFKRDQRALYLQAQLAKEKAATAVIYFTPNLTNAITTPAYLKDVVEPLVESRYPGTSRTVTELLRQRSENLEHRLTAGQLESVTAVFAREEVAEDLRHNPEATLDRLRHLRQVADQSSRRFRVCIAASSEMNAILGGTGMAMIYRSNQETAMAIGQQLRPGSPWAAMDSDRLCIGEPERLLTELSIKVGEFVQRCDWKASRSELEIMARPAVGHRGL